MRPGVDRYTCDLFPPSCGVWAWAIHMDVDMLVFAENRERPSE